MCNRSDIGIAGIGGTTVTGGGATIIAARGGTATVDMGTMDLCRGFMAGAAVITTITAIIEQKGRRCEPPSTSSRALQVVWMPLETSTRPQKIFPKSLEVVPEAVSPDARCMTYIRLCGLTSASVRGEPLPSPLLSVIALNSFESADKRAQAQLLCLTS
jgi:hypothetical protein